MRALVALLALMSGLSHAAESPSPERISSTESKDSSSFSEAAPSRHGLVGPGAASCSEFLTSAAAKKFVSDLTVIWAQGFLSGMNAGAYLSSHRPLSVLPGSQAIEASIFAYCKKNPQEPVYSAVLQLVASAKKDTTESPYQEKCLPKAPTGRTVLYPIELIGTNTYGTAVLILDLNPCGEVRAATFEKSSRNRILDSAARDAVMTWVLDPETVGLSPGRGGRIRVPVEFPPPGP